MGLVVFGARLERVAKRGLKGLGAQLGLRDHAVLWVLRDPEVLQAQKDRVESRDQSVMSDPLDPWGRKVNPVPQAWVFNALQAKLRRPPRPGGFVHRT